MTGAVSLLYGEVQKGQGYDRLWIGGVWLEQFLPLLALPEFAPSPLLSRLLSWDEGEQKEKEKEHWDRLVDHWQRHLHRLTRKREILIRDTATRSSSYEKLSRSFGTSQEAPGAGQQWLKQVLRDWFDSVDDDSEKRKLEVLRYLTPRQLPGEMRPEDREPTFDAGAPP